MEQIINWIRFFHYMAGVLENQANDPLCSKCKPFANTVRAMQGELAELDYARTVTLPPEVLKLLEKAGAVLHSIDAAENTEGQKKAGNCKMPKGVCFVKSSKAILKNIEKQTS